MWRATWLLAQDLHGHMMSHVHYPILLACSRAGQISETQIRMIMTQHHLKEIYAQYHHVSPTTRPWFPSTNQPSPTNCPPSTDRALALPPRHTGPATVAISRSLRRPSHPQPRQSRWTYGPPVEGDIMVFQPWAGWTWWCLKLLVVHSARVDHVRICMFDSTEFHFMVAVQTEHLMIVHIVRSGFQLIHYDG